MMHHLIPIFAAVLVCCQPAPAQQVPAPNKEIAAIQARAIAELRAKAEKGDATAEWNLGIMYACGQSVPKNEAEALKWYRKSAEHGNPDAQRVLGATYANGQGVPKNEAEGYKWLLLAGAQGNGMAKNEIAILEPNLTPAQRAEGQRMAREFKPSKSK